MPGVILILMGLLIGAISGVFHRVPNQKSTVGEIVSIEREPDPDAGRTMYTANVEYAVDGTLYTVKTRFKSPAFRTGQTMRVAYSKTDPEAAIVRPKVITYITMAAFIAAGLAVLCYTLFS